MVRHSNPEAVWSLDSLFGSSRSTPLALLSQVACVSKMSAKPSNRLAVALFRTMLKWSRSNADVPFSLRTGDLAVLAPTLRRQRSNTNTSGASALAAPLFSTSASLLQHYAEMGAAAVPLIARAEYDACRTAAARSDEEQAEATAAALDRGLECVRLLHTVYHQQLTAMRDMRQDRSDKTGVKFAVGQTFIHKKYGYRGVVYGWDRQCQRDDDWLKAMNVTNPNQPFYYCLPDETDCTRLFGGVRITKYCAQDNIQAISDTRIVHRALDAHFVAYSPTLSRYIPVKKTQYEYPDQYEAEDAAPVGDDANLLAQPEVEPSPATRLRSGRSKGRGFVSVKA